MLTDALLKLLTGLINHCEHVSASLQRFDVSSNPQRAHKARPVAPLSVAPRVSLSMSSQLSHYSGGPLTERSKGQIAELWMAAAAAL